MQPEHHLRKTEPGIVDGDAHVAGERHLQPAAEAETMNHGDRRNAQFFQAIDHRMGTHHRGLDLVDVAGAAEFVDVGAGNEAGGLGGADHHTGRPLVGDRGDDLVELFHHTGG